MCAAPIWAAEDVTIGKSYVIDPTVFTSVVNIAWSYSLTARKSRQRQERLWDPNIWTDIYWSEVCPRILHHKDGFANSRTDFLTKKEIVLDNKRIIDLDTFRRGSRGLFLIDSLTPPVPMECLKATIALVHKTFTPWGKSSINYRYKA